MSEPLVSEIRLFSYGHLPAGWLPCDGRLLDIASNQPLFSIVGFRQGGDYMNTFAVPTIPWDYPPLTFGIAVDGVYPPRGNEGHMDNRFVGEIRLFSGSSVPAGWSLCDGRELPVGEHAQLFALIGHTFGGADETFAIPDLRNRQPSEKINFIIALTGAIPTSLVEAL